MKPAATLLVVASLIGACSRPAATPRPEAYPRLEIYPPSYRPVSFGQLRLAVNDSARVDSLSPQWFNIVYPAYSITVNCSVTTGGDLDEVVANRRERFARNLGEHRARQITRSGLEVIVAPAALSTRVQFLFVASDSCVVSGVAVSSWPVNAAVDSVKPQIEALANDLVHLFK